MSELTEQEKNFVGWCVRKLDDYIVEFVDEAMWNELLPSDDPDE